jgi:hypothetical protein
MFSKRTTRAIPAAVSSSGYLLAARLIVPLVMALSLEWSLAQAAHAESSSTETELQIEINRIGLGKEVVITRGSKEWFMRVEVTPENSVVVRQEKEGDRYLVDESEVHDRGMTSAEVDIAINDYVNSVQTRQKNK